jgi:hypothetical protein
VFAAVAGVIDRRNAMLSGNFWKAAVERALKTAAQSFAAFLVADATGILEVDWVKGASIAGLATLLSVLTSVGSDAITSTPGPSLTSSETLKE